MLFTGMKKRAFLNYFSIGTFFALGILTLTGCPSSNSPSSPTSPAVPTSTATPTVTPTPIPGIFWENASIYNYNGIGDYATLNITVNGLPVTDVLAVVTGTSMANAVTLAYTGTAVISGVTYAQYYSSSTVINYTAGSNYTLHTIDGGVTAACTMTAPGNITVAPDGSQASWTVPGNVNNVWVAQGSTTLLSSGLVPSPYSIPASIYANPGYYTVWVDCDYSTGGGTTVTGAAAGSSFSVYDLISQVITVSTPTPTSTVSSTPTKTPTRTPSPTITQTPTITPTSTITQTPTLTPSPTITMTPTSTPPSASVTITASNYYYGIRYASGGNLWVTDTNNNALQEWTTAGAGPAVNITTFNGGATFHDPVGVGIDPASENVYVADSLNHQVEVFSSAGSYLATFAVAELGGQACAGVAVNSAGTTVYVSSSAIGSILVFSIGGTSSSPIFTYKSSFGGGSIVLPENINFDGSGNLWVADVSGKRLVEFNTSSGVSITSVPLANNGTPLDVAVDPSGNIFAVDNHNLEIQEFNSSGLLINTFGHAYLPLSSLTLDGTGTYLYFPNDSGATGIVGFKVN